MATEPRAPRAKTPAPASAAPAAPAVLEQIRMTIGMEGVGISRVPGQLLAIGTDINADEAGRLIDATFAVPA